MLNAFSFHDTCFEIAFSPDFFMVKKAAGLQVRSVVGYCLESPNPLKQGI